MICFAIALRSRESTNNWELVLKNFNNTIHSIFNQTNEEFEVYVGCNEIPKLYEEYDDRLHFLTADLPIPKTWEENAEIDHGNYCSVRRKLEKNILGSRHIIMVFLFFQWMQTIM